MEARDVVNLDNAKEIIEKRDIQQVKVGVFDLDGILRGKYMSSNKFLSALDKGFGFCSVVLGWDSNDKLYDNTKQIGWHTGYADADVDIIPSSCRELPQEHNALLFLGQFAGYAERLCPRGVLRRVVERCKDMGFFPMGGAEYEFFLFDETPQSLEEKNYQDPQPITPGNFGYSIVRTGVNSDFYRAMWQTCAAMGMPLEGLHSETGPGVLECALSPERLLRAADNAAIFKTQTKIIAQQHGWVASFMAKWSAQYSGSGGHLHISLEDKDHKSVFFDEDEEHNMSQTMRHFVAGQQILLPDLLALCAPTINSYTRLVPGYWAPTQASWGVENRTCALRVIKGSSKSQRVEYRVPGADANPYLAFAAALASGLWGIENKAELIDPIEGNAYELTMATKHQLPRALWEAAQRLKGSQMARDWFGDDFVEHFAASREWEARENRKQITDWQLKRYFEII